MGDPVLGGDVSKWQKTVAASFELKVLMNLSRVADDADLRVKERFAAIVSNKKLMESNEDNYQLVFSERKASVILCIGMTLTIICILCCRL